MNTYVYVLHLIITLYSTYIYTYTGASLKQSRAILIDALNKQRPEERPGWKARSSSEKRLAPLAPLVESGRRDEDPEPSFMIFT